MTAEDFEEIGDLCVNTQGRLVLEVQDYTEIIGVHEFEGEPLFTI